MPSEAATEQGRRPQPEPHSPARLLELDALRGFAACVVVLFHFTWRFGELFPAEPHLPGGVWAGRYGVEIFFAISGFVIFMTLRRTHRPADFAVSRLARLFPAYWAAIAFTTLVVHLLPMPALPTGMRDTLVNLSMLQAFFYLPNVDGVYWSLAVELAFYVCMFAIWRLGWLDRIERVAVGWLGLCLLWWAVPQLPSRIAMLFALDHIYYFIVGILAYRVWVGERRWIQQLPLLALGLGLLVLIHSWQAGVMYLIVTALFYALSRNWLSPIAHPVMLWLGAISYPLYLIHQHAGYALIVHTQRAGLGPEAAVALAIALSLGIAWAIHRLVEDPALAAIRGWWKKRR